jgi:DNA-binding HxlR family transcriptional regulator
MGSSADTDYCAFTKAVEHLGDRWSLLIVRELFMFGPQGFSTLAAGLPGHVSRSVLADKLRKLTDIGVVQHDRSDGHRQTPYRLAPAGEQLVPTLMSLHAWAEHWVPQDEAMAERDPSVITAWLKHRVDGANLPARQVALELTLRGALSERCWLLLARDTDRYVYVEADTAAIYPIARGVRGWSEAMEDGSVQVYGEPELIRELPAWFVAVEKPERTSGAAAAVA